MRPPVHELGPTAWHIVFLAKRDCGVTANEVERVCFIPRLEALRRLNGLVKLGYLQKQTQRVYTVTEPPRRTRPAPVSAPAPVAAERPAASPPPAELVAPPAPRIALPNPAAAVIVPPHVKRTVIAAPTHDPRYQCDPASRPYGGGFAAAGIGRDALTGKAWDQAGAEPMD